MLSPCSSALLECLADVSGTTLIATAGTTSTTLSATAPLARHARAARPRPPELSRRLGNAISRAGCIMAKRECVRRPLRIACIKLARTQVAWHVLNDLQRIGCGRAFACDRSCATGALAVCGGETPLWKRERRGGVVRGEERVQRVRRCPRSVLPPEDDGCRIHRYESPAVAQRFCVRLRFAVASLPIDKPLIGVDRV